MDHDHITGQFRGVICRFCNTGLGSFKDSVNYLTRAIEYLQNSSANTFKSNIDQNANQDNGTSNSILSDIDNI